MGLNELLLAYQKAQEKVIREMETLAAETGFPLSELEDIPKPCGKPSAKANLEYKKIFSRK